jgi:hypothetical protein
MKKAQLTNLNPQSMTALLIFIIGLTLVMYIMFLPPADRAELLEQNRTYKDGEKPKNIIRTLMTKEPGRLTNLAEDVVVKDLPSFNLFTRTDATSLISFDSIYIKKSLFEEQQRNISFNIDDFENTDNYVLSYTAPTRRGILTIVLNGNIILSRELTTASPSPLRLPRDYLENRNNLIFKVSGPGIEFWKSNEYIIENLQITADYTDRSSQENIQSFYISEQEKDNMESFQLRFVADCKALSSGPMEIYLNKRLIYNSVPDCGTRVLVPEVDGSRINHGENDLLFRTEKGNYLLYGLEITIKLREPIFPTYYFQLDEETFKKIERDDADVNVTLLFPNSIDRKKGVILINDYITEVDTYEASYSRNIDPFVRKNNNAIEIRPTTDKLDITELKIVLAE